jgi:hypothetical protein
MRAILAAVTATTPTPIAFLAFLAGLLAAGATGVWLYQLGFWRSRATRYLATGLGAVAFVVTFWLFIWAANGGLK